MSWLSDLKEIDRPKIVLALMGFMATIGPGFLIIYQFKPELIEKLDIVKLIVFSCSLTLPILLFSSIMIVAGQGKKELDLPTIFDCFISHAASSYLTIFLAYLFSWVFT